MQVRHALVLATVLLLAACGGKKDDDERTASGEVLKGTASDSELPLDTLTSQPPLMKTQPKAGSSDASDDADDQDAASLDSEQPEVESKVE